MMEKTQIGLPSEDHRRAKARAAELGISLAEYVRRLVRRDLGERRGVGDARSIVGLGRSTAPSDIAHSKDEYIGEAIEAEWARTTGGA